MGKFFTAIADFFRRIFTPSNIAAAGKVAADVAAEAVAVNAKDVPAAVTGLAAIAEDAKALTASAPTTATTSAVTK